MSPYIALDQFDSVRQYDINDPVKGGDLGESNEPIHQLANRTEYLFRRMNGYTDVVELKSDTVIDNTFSNKLIVVSGAANITLNVFRLRSFRVGTRITFVAAMGGAAGDNTDYWANINVVNDSNDRLADGRNVKPNIYMYEGESVELIAGPNFWKLTNARGNFDKIGQDDLKRFQPRNSFIGDGNNFSIAQYPRLWEVVKDTAISETDWFSDALRFRQFYSTGNGSTVARRPDMRSMSYRALDLSRGLSLARMDERSGGYEPDIIKSHDHTDTYDGINGQSDNANDRAVLVPGTAAKRTGTTGGRENTTKNAGMIPVIYF